MPSSASGSSGTPDRFRAIVEAQRELVALSWPDGTLDWDAPAGKWIVLRLGYSLTGEVNHPATPAATGLEVDKLSAKDVQAYVEEYARMISGAVTNDGSSGWFCFGRGNISAPAPLHQSAFARPQASPAVLLEDLVRIHGQKRITRGEGGRR